MQSPGQGLWLVAGGNLAGRPAVQVFGVSIETDEVGLDSSLGELRHHGIEGDDGRRIPDAGVAQVDLYSFDLHRVVVDAWTRSLVDAKKSSPLTAKSRSTESGSTTLVTRTTWETWRTKKTAESSTPTPTP